ncbi:membrane bound O-acyl transferase family-domain-containing protein [Phlebopus sp. FC_14]|nr:membrane bound O-acyl transferase family-domain-containing protein [Phlebopus sp. FC_14]
MNTTAFALLAAPYFALEVFITLNLPTPWRVAGCVTIAVLSFTSMTLVRTGNGYLDYLLGSSLVTCVADSIHLLLLTRPLYSFRHEKDKVPAHELPFFQRYFWVICMCHSPRGIGWSFRVNNIPRASTFSRASFATYTMLRAIFQYTLFEAAYLYMSYNPVFTTSASITSQGFLRQSLSIAAFVGQTYAVANFLYFFLASVSVAMGLYEPRLWPDIFGRWRDAYTIRRFWGRTWHQLLRRFLSVLGKSPARLAGLDPRTRGLSYVQLSLAFLVSGLAHVGGDAMLDISSAGFSLPFFLLQPIGIAVEDVVISLARRTGVKQCIWTRLVGYAWVFIWLSTCVPPWLDVFVNVVIRTQGLGVSGPRKTLLGTVAGWAGVDIGSVLSSWFANV